MLRWVNYSLNVINFIYLASFVLYNSKKEKIVVNFIDKLRGQQWLLGSRRLSVAHFIGPLGPQMVFNGAVWCSELLQMAFRRTDPEYFWSPYSWFETDSTFRCTLQAPSQQYFQLDQAKHLLFGDFSLSASFWRFDSFHLKKRFKIEHRIGKTDFWH